MIQVLTRLVLAFLATVLLTAVVGFIFAWTQTRREYDHFSKQLAESESQLAAMQAERETKEAYLRAFLNDPEVVERVVRERLGYVRPDETIFRYETW